MFEGEYVSDSEEDVPLVIPIASCKKFPAVLSNPVIAVPSPDTTVDTTLPAQVPKTSNQAEKFIDSEPLELFEEVDEIQGPQSPDNGSLPQVPEFQEIPRQQAPQFAATERLQTKNTQLPPTQPPKIIQEPPQEPYHRSLRQRRANQLRPYTYDTYKYGEINYDYRTSSSPDFFQDPQRDSLGSSEYRYEANGDSLENISEQEDQSDQEEAASDPGRFELAVSPPAPYSAPYPAQDPAQVPVPPQTSAAQNPARESKSILREIDSSDEEDGYSHVPQPRKSKFAHPLPQATKTPIVDLLGAASSEDQSDSSSCCSSDGSEIDSGSEGSMMEAPLQLDFMMSRTSPGFSNPGSSRKQATVTDLMRTAARSAGSKHKKSTRTTKSSTGTAKRAKTSKAAKLRQSRISTESKASRGVMIANTVQGSERRTAERVGSEGVRTSRAKPNDKTSMHEWSILPGPNRASWPSHRDLKLHSHRDTPKDWQQDPQRDPQWDTAAPTAKSRATTPRTASLAAMKPISKRKRHAALENLAYSRRHPNTPKRARAAPQPNDIYFTPIYEQEAANPMQWVEPEEPEYLNYEEWEMEVPTRSKHSDAHVFWFPQPPSKAKLPLHTFVGSNTLLLRDTPEHWNGQSAHTQIAGIVSTQEIGKTMDLHCAQLVDDDILETTFTDIYDYYFQLSADLMRPELLLETQVREYILSKSSQIMDKILQQIDRPQYTARARLAFGIFALCAGYSGCQVGFAAEYEDIKAKVFQLALRYVKTIKNTLASNLPYDRGFVAAEILLTMHRLGVWAPQVQAFEGHPEMKWQLIFISAWVQKFEQNTYSDWSSVLLLLTPDLLDKGDRKEYINRCITLLGTWHWPVVKAIVKTLFAYYDQHKKYGTVFDSGSDHVCVKDIPKMVTQGFKGRVCDNEWESFLELMGLSVKLYAEKPDFDEFRDSLVPTSTWKGPSKEPLDWQQISSVTQRLSITLTLFLASPSPKKLSIERVLGVMEIQDSHLTARLRAIRACWVIIMEATTGVDVNSCADWLGKVAKYSFEQYKISLKSSQTEPQFDIPFSLFYEEMYAMLKVLPAAGRYYSPYMFAPLNLRPSPKMEKLLWKMVPQLPNWSLADYLPLLKRYNQKNQPPMDVYISILERLGSLDLEWPHANKPEFLASVISRRRIPRECINRAALEFAARPSWENNEQRFFNAFEQAYGVSFGGKREEIVRTVLGSLEDAQFLLAELEKFSKERELDRFEQLVFEGLCHRMRSVVFHKYPELSRKYSYRLSQGDEIKDSLLGYIKGQNWTGFQYYVSHKISIGLKQNDFQSLVTELMPCLQYVGDCNRPVGFEALVNRLFASYVRLAINRAQMGKFIVFFAQVTLRAIEFSDTLRYDPLKFLTNLAAYLVKVLKARQFVDWRAFALFMRICGSCVRKLHVSNSPEGPWLVALPRFVELAKATQKYKAGDLDVVLPVFESDAQPVQEDFLRLAKDPIFKDDGEMDVGQAIALFLRNYDCLNSTTLLL